MAGEPDNDGYAVGKIILNVLFFMVVVFCLGSCMSDISDISVPYNRGQAMLSILLYYMFVVFLGVMVLYGFLLFLLEKVFLTQREIDGLNRAAQMDARKNISQKLGRVLGVPSERLEGFLKPKNEKKLDDEN